MTLYSKILLLIFLVLPTLARSADFDLRKRIPWGEGKNGKFETAKVIPFWSEAVLNQPNGKSLRGFGGRLLFYGRDQKKTVQVKGTLVVYAFDEDGRDPSNVKPDRKYVFQPEDFEKTHAKNEVGHSYNIWLPWDEVGGPQKEISLIVRFTSEKGDLVISEQQRQRLNGADIKNPSDLVTQQIASAKSGVSTNVTLVPPGANQATLPQSLQQAAFQQSLPQVTNSVMTGSSGMIQATATQPTTSTPLNARLPITQQTTSQQFAVVQQTAAQEMIQPMQPNSMGEKRMETTTIQLPPMTAARWNQQTMATPAQAAMPPQAIWAHQNPSINNSPGTNASTSQVVPANGITAQGLGLPAVQQSSPNRMQGQAPAAPTLFGAHYVPGTHQAPTWQAAPQGLGPARWQQFPAAPRFAPPSAQQAVQSP